MTAHDLHHRAALVRLHGVTQLVDALNGGVAGGVKADGVVGTADVIVNGGGNAHNLQIHAFFGCLTGQGQRTAERTVAADGYDAVQSQQLAGGKRFGAAFSVHKFLAAGGVEHGAALVDDMTDAGGVHGKKIAVDQAAPAAADTHAVHAVVHGGTHNGAHGCVHAGGVTAAGQNADASYFFLHSAIALLPEKGFAAAANRLRML